MTRHGVFHNRPVFQSDEQVRLFYRTSKRALWVALKHMAARDTGEYEKALENGGWFSIVKAELKATASCE